MFGYVTQKEFEAEHALRLKAERLAVALGNRLADLKLSIADFRQMYKDQVDFNRILMERLTAKDAPPVPPDTGPVFEEMTEEQIMATPANGKREMLVRKARAAAARMKEENRRNVDAQRRREDLLTPEERHATMPDFDPTLGIFVEPLLHREDEDVVNDIH